MPSNRPRFRSGVSIDPLERRVFLSAAGLLPTPLKSTVPTSTVAGEKAGGSIKVALTNSLATVEKGKATVAVYASTDLTLDPAADVLVGSLTKPVNVKPGKKTAVTVAVKTLAALPAGFWYLLVATTDSAGNTAEAAVPQTVNMATATVIFTPAFVGRGLPPTAKGNQKLKGSVRIRLTNTGNATSPGPVFVGVTASLTPGLAGYGIFSKSFKLKIKAGKSAVVSVPVKLLPAIPAGVYYTVAVVSDPSAGISYVTAPGTTTVIEG
jgi:hypothetical protein